MHGSDNAIEEPTCPICLQAFEPLDRALITSCLHAFCIGCLQAWCRKSEKRLCPLCKRRITGYLHHIRSDSNYQEHIFNDEPARAQQQLEQWPIPPIHPPEVVHIDSSRNQQPYQQQQPQNSTQNQQRNNSNANNQRYNSSGFRQHVAQEGQGTHETQRPRIQLRNEAGYTWGDPFEWRRDVLQAGRRSSSNSRAVSNFNHHHPQYPSSRHRSSSNSRRFGSDAADGQAIAGADGSVAPRPYYWRVQQRMLASVTRLSSNSNPALGDSNAALEARRAIYRNNLWALPHPSAVSAAAAASGASSLCRGGTVGSSPTAAGTAAAAGGSAGIGGSSSSMRVSEAALEFWMERELQALLMEPDVTILSAYVKGLVNSFGIMVPTGQQQQQAQQQQEGVNEACLQNMRQAASQAAAAALGATAPAAAAGADGAGAVSNSSSSRISSAVAALEGFLFETAAHFWHELCCYASSGLTVAAWDRVARYVPADVLQQQQQQQQQHPGVQHAAVTRLPAAVATAAGTTAAPTAAATAATALTQQRALTEGNVDQDYQQLQQQQQEGEAELQLGPVTVAAAAIATAAGYDGRLGRRGSSSSGSSSSREQQQSEHHRDSSLKRRSRSSSSWGARDRSHSRSKRHKSSRHSSRSKHKARRHRSNTPSRSKSRDRNHSRHIYRGDYSRSSRQKHSIRHDARSQAVGSAGAGASGSRHGRSSEEYTGTAPAGAAASAPAATATAPGGRWGDEDADQFVTYQSSAVSVTAVAEDWFQSGQYHVQQQQWWQQGMPEDRWQLGV